MATLGPQYYSFFLPWGLIDGWDNSSIGKILLVDVNSIILADNFLDALTKRDNCFTVVFVLKSRSKRYCVWRLSGLLSYRNTATKFTFSVFFLNRLVASISAALISFGQPPSTWFMCWTRLRNYARKVSIYVSTSVLILKIILLWQSREKYHIRNVNTFLTLGGAVLYQNRFWLVYNCQGLFWLVNLCILRWRCLDFDK